jgi:hypothetical protein
VCRQRQPCRAVPVFRGPPMRRSIPAGLPQPMLQEVCLMTRCRRRRLSRMVPARPRSRAMRARRRGQRTASRARSPRIFPVKRWSPRAQVVNPCGRKAAFVVGFGGKRQRIARPMARP